MRGSLDNIQDALDALGREKCCYVLVIGRPDEHVTRTWCDLMGNHDMGTKVHVIQSVTEALNQLKEPE